MARKHIMLVCSAGMSTSLLVTKMQKAAAEKEVDVNIFAVGASAVDEHIAKNEVDMMLIAPQVRFMTGQLEEKVNLLYDKIAQPKLLFNMAIPGIMAQIITCYIVW